MLDGTSGREPRGSEVVYPLEAEKLQEAVTFDHKLIIGHGYILWKSLGE
jgi:hypothetical protein